MIVVDGYGTLVVVEVGAGVDVLHDDERPLTAKFGEKRLRTFCAGRQALRAALQAAGVVVDGAILRDPLALDVHQREIALRDGQPLIGGAPQPLDRFAIVLPDALPLDVAHRQIRLSLGEPLIRRSLQPLRPGRRILSNAHAFVIHQSKIDLRRGKPLLRRQSRPFESLLRILGNTGAFDIQ